MIRNKWFVLLVLIVVMLGAASIKFLTTNKSLETIPELQIVDTKMLTNMINSKKDMVIVDLREPELFSNSRVTNSINIPFEEIQLRYTELPKDKEIVFVCHTGRMGVESGNLLLENGYNQVYNLDGGMAKWTGDLEK